MKLSKKCFYILIIFLVILLLSSIKSYGTALTVSASSSSIKVGSTTTVSIKASSLTGKVTIKSSNTSVATVSSSSEWVENNTIKVTVTGKSAGKATVTVSGELSDASGNDSTYTKSVSITVKTTSSSGSGTSTTKSSVATLSNLGVTPKEYDFTGFKPSVTGASAEYAVVVPNNVTKLSVYATTTSSKATYSVSGNTGFKEGTNVISVKVTAEDGKTTKTYKIYVTRQTSDEETVSNTQDEDEDQSPSTNEIGLKSLQIEGYELDKDFDTNTFNYRVEIGTDRFDDLEELESLIDAVTNYDKAEASIDITEGNEDDYYLYEATITVADEEKEYAVYSVKFVESLEEMAEVVDEDDMLPEDKEAEERLNSSDGEELWFGYDKDLVQKAILLGVCVLLFLICIIQSIRIHKKNKKLREYESKEFFENEENATSEEIENQNDAKTETVGVGDDGVQDSYSEYSPRYTNPRRTKKSGRRFL